MTRIFTFKAGMARGAAAHAARSLRGLLGESGSVRLLAATGASQLDFLDMLAKEQGIDWSRVELFHLDEYVGTGIEHPASFARYIKERVVDRLGIRNFRLLDGLGDPHVVARQMSEEIASAPVQLAFCGIGENGHLAFNDPPADFEASEPYIVVELDEACRRQQVGEGWFPSMEDVPKRAITISIPWLLKTGEILCIVPDRRKAEAVKACLEGPVSPMAPGSILRVHPNAHIFLDEGSAELLNRAVISEASGADAADED
jgi:glucosamine-6-phosphate deaminase